MFMNDRKLIILLLALVAVLTIMPAGAYAATEKATEKTTFRQEFTYREGETPNIREEIIQFGHIFRLVSVSEPVASATLPAGRSYTYQLSKEYTQDQLSQAPKNVKTTPIYGIGKRQVDRKETIKNLPDNDVDRLPHRKIFRDTNGRGPGAKTAGELALAEVRYEPVGRDEHGVPNEYNAYVVYRGEETYTALLYYEGVTTYTETAGEDGITTYTVVATYESDAPVSGSAAEPAAAGPGGGGAGDGTENVAASGARSPALLFPPGTLSPLGAAVIATVAAAILTLVFLGIYNRRKLREAALS